MSPPSRTAGRDDGHRLRAWLAPVESPDDHRVTTFELFFDLVYVFSFTQVTGWLVHEHSLRGTLQGLVVLALLWWTWTAYSWLGNHFRADAGMVWLSMQVAMAAVFVAGLTIPALWTPAPGAAAPAVFVACYALIRTLHLAVYLVAGRADRGLRRQILLSACPSALSIVLLVVGASLAAGPRLAAWGAALAVDLLGIWWLAARLAGWRIRSPGHFAERFGLVVIMALGESVIAIGVGASGTEPGAALLSIAVLGVGLAVTLWWVYFRRTAPAVERLLAGATARQRTRIATDAYTYLHFPVVAGIVVTAAGVEGIAAAAGTAGHGTAAAVLLVSGVATFTAAVAALRRQAGVPWLPLAAGTAVLPLGVAGAGVLDARALLALVILALVAAGTAGSRTPPTRSAGT